jgi:2-phosphosulfolactate phosphatase
MDIRILHQADDIEHIAGLTVVIDVFRAFSTACFVMSGNPLEYIPVDSVERAFSFRRSVPGAILIGERDGFKIDGFDFGNSPAEVKGRDFSRNVIVHTTTAGTHGLLRVPEECETITGSFVNASAVIGYIRKRNPGRVNLFCTARRKGHFGEEDDLCAAYLFNGLSGIPDDFALIRRQLENGGGRTLMDGGFAQPDDFDLCMDLDRFDFVVKRIFTDDSAAPMRLVRV